MAKLPTRSATPRKTNVYRAGSLLAGIVVILLVLVFASTNDIEYSSKSLMAAAIGMFDQSPTIVISRDQTSVNRRIMPGNGVVLNTFSVTSRNATSIVYLKNFVATIAVAPSGTGLVVNALTATYKACSTLCTPVKVPITVVRNGDTYTVTAADVKLPVYLPYLTNGSLSISADVYYPGPTSAAGAPVAGVITDITSATGSVSMDRYLAYGVSRVVFRSVGYGYGDYDLISDGVLDAGDVSYLQRVIQGEKDCPSHKVCDLNGDKVVNVGDAIALVRIISQLKPQ